MEAEESVVIGEGGGGDNDGGGRKRRRQKRRFVVWFKHLICIDRFLSANKFINGVFFLREETQALEIGTAAAHTRAQKRVCHFGYGRMRAIRCKYVRVHYIRLYATS